MKTNVQSIITDTNVSDISDTLAYYGLIDIGTIVQVDENNRAIVKSCYRAGKRFVAYKDVEIIYPGCSSGAFMTVDRQCMCLLFVPRSCIPNIGSKKIALTKGLYSAQGVKALPISNGANVSTSLSFNDSGDLSVASSNYAVTFSKDHITASMMKKLHMIMDNQGQIVTSYKGASGSVYRTSMQDLIVKKEFITEDAMVRYIFEISGKEDAQSLVIKQVDGSDTEKLPIMNAITIKKDGSVQIARKEQGNLITIDTAGNVSVNVLDPEDSNKKRDITVTATNVKVTAETMELMGNTKNLVTYAELETALKKFKSGLDLTLKAGTAPNGPLDFNKMPLQDFDISAAKAADLKTK